MPGKRILILGGTGEARSLAAALLAAGYDAVTSLAGVTGDPLLPVGNVRRGGFGGSDGLSAYLRGAGIAAIIDATHPFATQISRNAEVAAAASDVALLRLERPAWEPQAGDNWTIALSASSAALALLPGARAFVTIGRKEVGEFFRRADISGVARMIEAPGVDVPPGWRLILQRPPFSLEHEVSIMAAHHITHVVAKNSGGGETEAKLAAARQLGLPVIMIARPVKPEVTSVATVGVAIDTLAGMLLP